MEGYLADDRLNRVLLSEDIAKMTDEEFEEFIKQVKIANKYPSKYYL